MSFTAELTPSAIKVFGYALDALVKFSDELHFEARKDQLIIWSVNMSMTAQAIIRLSPKLFTKYKIKQPRNNDDATPPNPTTVSCRVLVKALRKIFRHNQNITGHIEHCEIKLNENSSNNRSAVVRDRLYLKFVCTSGMTKTHSLWYADSEKIQTLYNKNGPHSFSVDPVLISDYINLMDPRIQDITFVFLSNQIIMKTFWERSLTKSGGKPMQSEFKLSPSDFIAYSVDDGVTITIGIKELRTTLNYGIDSSCVLVASFDGPGKPIVFTLQQSGTMLADFAIMAHVETDSIAHSTGLSESNISINTDGNFTSNN
ncbi:unnamed protein product [Cunninghamella echinulata]